VKGGVLELEAVDRCVSTSYSVKLRLGPIEEWRRALLELHSGAR